MATYLITGGAGFIGSHLARALVEHDQQVILLDNFNDYYDPNLKRKNIKALIPLPNVTLIEGDVRDQSLLMRIFAEHPVTYIAHLAALAGVRASVTQTPQYMDVNAIGTMRLLEAAMGHQVRQIVLASTSSVYGETKTIPFVEDDAADRPLAAYPASKRAAEILAYTYHHLHGANITVLRFFNVYGPAGRPDMMPLKLLNATQDDRVIRIFNNGDIYRDWTYISDTVAGILTALEHPLGYEIINLGCGNPISLREFITVIERYANRRINTVSVPTPASDPPITYCNNEKARRLLDFDPQVSIEAGLLMMWEWFHECIGV